MLLGRVYNSRGGVHILSTNRTCGDPSFGGVVLEKSTLLYDTITWELQNKDTPLFFSTANFPRPKNLREIKLYTITVGRFLIRIKDYLNKESIESTWNYPN